MGIVGFRSTNDTKNEIVGFRSANDRKNGIVGSRSANDQKIRITGSRSANDRKINEEQSDSNRPTIARTGSLDSDRAQRKYNSDRNHQNDSDRPLIVKKKDSETPIRWLDSERSTTVKIKLGCSILIG